MFQWLRLNVDSTLRGLDSQRRSTWAFWEISWLRINRHVVYVPDPWLPFTNPRSHLTLKTIGKPLFPSQDPFHYLIDVWLDLPLKLLKQIFDIIVDVKYELLHTSNLSIASAYFICQADNTSLWSRWGKLILQLLTNINNWEWLQIARTFIKQSFCRFSLC